MQVQRIQNNNYNTNFREKICFDPKMLRTATVEQRDELMSLKRQIQNLSSNNSEVIKIEFTKGMNTVKEVIDYLYEKLRQIEFVKRKSETISAAFGPESPIK